MSGVVGTCGASLFAKLSAAPGPGVCARARVAAAPAAAAPTTSAPPFKSSLRLLSFVLGFEPMGSSLNWPKEPPTGINPSDCMRGCLLYASYTKRQRAADAAKSQLWTGATGEPRAHKLPRQSAHWDSRQ